MNTKHSGFQDVMHAEKDKGGEDGCLCDGKFDPPFGVNE
jgi:hypothetical protein